MKRLFTISVLILVSLCAVAKNPKVWKRLKSDVNIFMVSDTGRNGYYDQKPIAKVLGEMAEAISPSCIIASGDVHHFEGVASVSDPLWMTNYELIYDHPKLMIPWYAVLGNHEYRGNTQAVLDYANISSRWDIEGRYYTKVIKNKGTTVRFVMIDTTPLIDNYRKSKGGYAAVALQDYKAQLKWIESVLEQATEDWVVVVGHHPIYADTGKSSKERSDMQKRVDSILRKYDNKVSLYVAGHIHNFQHIKMEGCNIDYVVNSSAARSRSVKEVEGTQFCSPETGFAYLTANKKSLCLHMINKKGKVLHTITKTK